MCALFQKIACQNTKKNSPSLRMYVCCRNAAPALLKQRTDLKFFEHILNEPILCRFFQIFDISLNLAVNEKIWVSVGTHLKAKY